MTGSTLSGNTATTSGGAIFNLDTLRLTLSTLAGNTASGSGPDLFGPVTTDGGGNVIGNTANSTGLVAASDKLDVPALLGPLANNGGLTQTFALLPGSPAIDIATSPAFTANASLGLLTITATASGSTATTFSETVTPGAAATFTVSGFPSPVTSGVSGTVTVTAKDASSNTATSYGGTVHVTSSDAAAILPANATLTSGVGMFAVTLTTPGLHTITATDTATSTITGTQTALTATGGAACRGNGAIGGDPERATREEISTPPPPLLQPRGTGALQGRTGVG